MSVLTATSQPTYTTPTNHILTTSNAPTLLCQYLQSFPLPPQTFKHTITYTTTPDPRPPARLKPPKPLAPDQPPLDSLFNATITLPSECAVHVASSTGTGWRSKDMARKVAMFEIVKALFLAGEISSELKPTPQGFDNITQTNNPKPAKRSEERLKERMKVILQDGTRDPGDDITANQRIEAMRKAIKDKLPPKTTFGTGMYEYITHADYWGGNEGFRSDNLHVVVLELFMAEPNEEKGRLCRKVCLLTSRELPVFGDGEVVDVDLGMGNVGSERVDVGAVVRLRKGGKLKALAEGKLEEIMAFTQRLLRAHLNRPIYTTLETTKWLIAPLLPDLTLPITTPLKIKRKHISWSEISQSLGPIASPFSLDPSTLARESLDAMTTTHSEFSRRYFIDTLRTDLSPSSPNPSNPSITISENKTPRHDYGTAPPPLTSLAQPILQCTQVHPTRTGGFIASCGMTFPSEYLIPETIYRHSIPASIYRTTSTLPALLTHIDDQLIANQMNDRYFQGMMSEKLALQAIMTPTCQPLHPGRTYQRLEYLGDTLLKLVVTVWCDLKRGNGEGEGGLDEMHVERHGLVSNRSLMNWVLEKVEGDAADSDGEAGLGGGGGVDDAVSGGRAMQGRRGLVGYIRGRSLRRGEWMPLGWGVDRIEGEKIVEEGKQQLGDKTIADVAEALIGAAYLSTPADQGPRIDGAIRGIKSLGVPLDGLYTWDDVVKSPHGRSQPNSPAHSTPLNGGSEAHLHSQGSTAITTIKSESTRLHHLSLQGSMSAIPATNGISATPSWMKTFQPRDPPVTLLGYTFKDPSKARNVLSLSHDQKRRAGFDRGKLLGDAVLDYFLIEELFNKYTEAGPGPLSHMRHSRHGETALAALSVTSGLIDRLVDVPAELQASIKKYKNAILAAKKISDKGEEFERKEFWAEVVFPDFLSSLTDTLLGQILLDSSYHLPTLSKIYNSHFSPFFKKYCLGPEDHPSHPNAVIWEFVLGGGCTGLEVVRLGKVGGNADGESRVWGTEVKLHGHMIGRGEAENQLIATRRANENALSRLRNEGLGEWCVCENRGKKDTGVKAGLKAGNGHDEGKRKLDVQA